MRNLDSSERKEEEVREKSKSVLVIEYMLL